MVAGPEGKGGRAGHKMDGGMQAEEKWKGKQKERVRLIETRGDTVAFK